MSAFKKHFLAYLIHPNGYDCKVPGLTIQNMDEKVDHSDYMTCMNHALAVWALAGGLFRVDPQARGANSVVFNYQSVNPTRIAKTITKLLPKQYTSKAMRKGAVTEMRSHRNTSEADVNFRSGHQPNDVTASYTVFSRDTSVPGAKALAGFVNVRGEQIVAPKLPLDILPRQKDYIKVFFSVNLNIFTTGRLQPVLPMLLATLIRHFNKMLSDGFSITNCPTINDMVKKVMALEGISASEAKKKLQAWSKSVDDEFVLANNVAIGAMDTGDMLEQLKSNATLLTAILQKMNRFELELKDLNIKLGGVQDEVVNFTFPPEHTKMKRGLEEDLSMSASSSQLSKSIFPAKRVKTETSSKNNKNPEIDALLESAALANDVSGTGDQFCLRFCKKYESMQNEIAKIKTSMSFVSQWVSEAEMAVLKLGNPGNDMAKMQSLKKTCADIKKKVVDELMKRLGKVKPGPTETFTVVSIAGKLKTKTK